MLKEKRSLFAVAIGLKIDVNNSSASFFHSMPYVRGNDHKIFLNDCSLSRDAIWRIMKTSFDDDRGMPLTTSADPDDDQAADLKQLCPVCSAMAPSFYTDCYDKSGARVCGLWYCAKCRNFFPVDVTIPSRRSKPSSSENRIHTRFDTWFVVEVSLRDSGFSEPIVATVLNASSGGVFFPFPRKLEEHSIVLFRISLPSASRSFEARGEVVRCSEGTDGRFGIAVRFTDVDSRYEAALDRYVRASFVKD